MIEEAATKMDPKQSSISPGMQPQHWGVVEAVEPGMADEGIKSFEWYSK